MAGRFPILRDYEVLAEIGRGTLGTVYKALNQRHHDLVALKQIETTSLELRVRLLRSFEAARAVTHPGVCTLRELVETSSSVFIASELVEGHDLLAFLEPPVGRDPERVKRAVYVLGQVLKVLAAIHRQGLVHRGLKPSNVLVARGGRVKVTDIDLSREWDLRSAGTMPVSADRLSAYHAPEQLLGDPIDARADLYAFGLLLYETLSGRKPHQGASLLLQVEARTTEPALPLHAGDARIEQAFGPFLDRLLSPAREARPASAEAALRALGEAWESYAKTAVTYAEAGGAGARASAGAGAGADAAVDAAAGEDGGVGGGGLGPEPAATHEASRMLGLTDDDEDDASAPTSSLSLPDLTAPGTHLAAAEERVQAMHAATSRLHVSDLHVIEILSSSSPEALVAAGPPLVGRTELMDRLVRELDLAAAGSATLIALGGEAGVGKSRLVSEIAETARTRGDLVVAGRACGSADPERGPLATLLDDVARRLAGLSPAEWHVLVPDGLAALASLSSGFRQLLGPSGSGGDQAPATGNAELLQALASLLKRFSGDGVLLVVLEDVEASDALSLALLGDLTRALLAGPRGSRTRVLPIVTFRSDTIEPEHAFLRGMAELSDEGLADRLDVPRLDESSAFHLASSVLGLDPLPEALRRVIWKRTDGNALFVLETATQMREHQIVQFRDGARSLDEARLERYAPEPGLASLTDAASSPSPPARVRAVLQERLARRSSEARDLLRAVAIAGGELEVERLHEEAVAGEREPTPWPPLQELRDASLLLPAPGRPGLYRLDPGPLRDVIVATLAIEDRARLAARVAQALERSGRIEPSQAPLLATLHAASGDTERLRACLPVAAQALTESRDLRGALRLWRSFLEVGGAGELERRARAEVASLLLALGEVAAAAAAFRERLLEPEMGRAPHDRVAALIGLAEASYRSGNLVAAEPRARDAAENARALDAPAAEARALECLAAVARRRVERERAHEHLARALEIHQDLDDRHGIARVRSQLGSRPFAEDDPAAARLHLDEALAIRERLKDRAGRASTVLKLGALDLRAHDVTQALARAEDAIRLDTMDADARALALARAALAEVLLADGDFRRALAGFESTLVTLEALGDGHGVARALVGLGHTYARTNNPREALRRFEAAVLQLQRSEDPLLECEARTALGQVADETGDNPRAVAEVGRAIAIAEARRLPARLIAARLSLARLTRSVDRANEALALAQTLRDETLLLRCHHVIGLLKLAAGDRESAREHLRRALAIVSSIGEGLGAGRDAFLHSPEIEPIVRDARRA